jgi:hypothetical protein
VLQLSTVWSSVALLQQLQSFALLQAEVVTSYSRSSCRALQSIFRFLQVPWTSGIRNDASWPSLGLSSAFVCSWVINVTPPSPFCSLQTLKAHVAS